MSTGGILTDLAIRAAVDNGEIEIDPFDPKQLNPASYDLRLGDEVLVYNDWVTTNGLHVRERGGPLYASQNRVELARDVVLDTKKAPLTTRFVIGDEGVVLEPNIGYLMHTVERVHTKRFVPIIDGKSSVARLFTSIHECAGFGDAGFDGQYTLEVTCKHPIRLYAGMRIAQIRFHTMHGEVGKLYAGNYAGETSRGAVASRAWKQFEKDGSK